MGCQKYHITAWVGSKISHKYTIIYKKFARRTALPAQAQTRAPLVKALHAMFRTPANATMVTMKLAQLTVSLVRRFAAPAPVLQYARLVSVPHVILLSIVPATAVTMIQI
jgi:hypothetical protein